jgi:Fe2+ transport system protein FeoA
MDGKMPRQISKPLADIEEEGRFIVDSVSDQDALLLRRLNADGITPGAPLEVTTASRDEFVLRTARASKALRLPRDLAGAILVRSTDGRRS